MNTINFNSLKKKQFKTNSIKDVEVICNILYEKFDNKINVIYDYNSKLYTISIDENNKRDENVNIPIDVSIQVIYGDSVVSDTPVLLRDKNTKQVYIKTIDSISDNWKEYPEFKLLDNSVRLDKSFATTHLQIYSDKGWTDIKKIIRHKTNKKIYRVLTHTGCVDVTEDHSLMTEYFEKIKPTEIKLGDCLAHSFPSEFTENEKTIVKMKKEISETKICKKCNSEKDVNEFYKKITENDGRTNVCRDCEYYSKSEHPLRNVKKNFIYENYELSNAEAEVWGFFMSDGSCGSYTCKSGIKNSWTLNSQNLEYLNYYKNILENIEPVNFKILDTLKSSGVYKLVPQKSIKHMVDKYRPLFYDTIDCNADGNKYKIIPNIILNASKDIKKSFWIGYWKGDGCKSDNYNINNPRFSNKGKIGSQCLYYLMRSLGFNMYLNLRNDEKKKEIYAQALIKNTLIKDNAIKKIIHFRDSTLEEYVYDIETECGRFNCGVGQMTVSNTDSIFISMKYNRENYEENRKSTFYLAQMCADKLTNEIFNRPPIVLEFEKIFQPFILLTKKRYIANKYEDSKNPMKLKCVDFKGIAITRRDYCKMVKNCYNEIIGEIMKNEIKSNNQLETILNNCIQIYKNYIIKIEQYNLEDDDIVLSAMLAKSYKTNPVHVVLAQKLKDRKEEVQIGDRIQYIYIEDTTNNKLKKSELGEDPLYAKQNGLKPNRCCYLEQLAKPILGFFKIVLMDSNDKLEDLINYTNDKIVEFGGKKFKPSDFILNTSD